MSKKSASRHVEGQGSLVERRKAMEAVKDDEAAKLLAAAMRSEARELARKHSPSAVRVLRRLMLSKDVPANVRRLCALDLIELGEPPKASGGASLSRLPSGGFTVVVAQRPGQVPATVAVRAMPNLGEDARVPEKRDDLDPDDPIADAETA